MPDVLSAFDVSVFCPSPTEGAPRAVILGMLASRPCLSTGAEGVCRHDHARVRWHHLPGERPRCTAAADRRATLTIPAVVVSQGAAARAYAERTYAAPVVAERIEGLFNEAIAGEPFSRE